MEIHCCDVRVQSMMIAIEELQFQGRVELMNIRVSPARVISN